MPTRYNPDTGNYEPVPRMPSSERKRFRREKNAKEADITTPTRGKYQKRGNEYTRTGETAPERAERVHRYWQPLIKPKPPTEESGQ